VRTKPQGKKKKGMQVALKKEEKKSLFDRGKPFVPRGGQGLAGAPTKRGGWEKKGGGREWSRLGGGGFCAIKRNRTVRTLRTKRPL